MNEKYNWSLAISTIRTYSNNFYSQENIEQAITIFEPKPKVKTSNEKEFLYIGHYVDTQGRYILKIGTTNNLNRRRTEHTRNYRRAKDYTMPKDSVFIYDWFLALSKYNTLRYEDRNRADWKNLGIGNFVRNDRFCCESKPSMVKVTIRKTYEILL